MAANASQATLPNYFRQTDVEALFRKHPLPDEFERGMYRWSGDRIRAHQEMLFREVLANAWTDRFYQKKWRAAGLETGDVRGLDDLHKLPIVTVYDFKEAIDEEPPCGAHQGITPADAAREPLKIQSSGGTTGRPRPTGGYLQVIIGMHAIEAIPFRCVMRSM